LKAVIEVSKKEERGESEKGRRRKGRGLRSVSKWSEG
jgi:hypothetical protein